MITWYLNKWEVRDYTESHKGYDDKQRGTYLSIKGKIYYIAVDSYIRTYIPSCVEIIVNGVN